MVFLSPYSNITTAEKRSATLFWRKEDAREGIRAISAQMKVSECGHRAHARQYISVYRFCTYLGKVRCSVISRDQSSFLQLLHSNGRYTATFSCQMVGQLAINEPNSSSYREGATIVRASK